MTESLKTSFKHSMKSDDPNHIYMIWEVGDPQKAREVLNDPEMQDIMRKSGVIDQPEIIFLNDGQ